MNNRVVAWTIFIVLCFIWGSSFRLMTFSSQQLNANTIAALRIFAAGIVFLPFAVFHLRGIPRNKIGSVILAGIFGNLLPAFMFAIALTKIDSSLGAIFNSLTPVCVAVIGIVFYRDFISKQKMFGILLGFAGAVLLLVTQDDISLNNMGYAALTLAGTIFYGINVNMVGHNLQGVDPIKVATVSLAFMIIPSGAVLLQQDFLSLDFSDHDLQWALMASALLGIVGSAIATALFYVLVKLGGGLFASLVTYGIPFVALFWGIIYRENITIARILCLCVILVGVYLANRKPEIKQT